MQVFDAMRVSSGNSFCWETEVPRMLKGDYFPDFTAQMMLKVPITSNDTKHADSIPKPHLPSNPLRRTQTNNSVGQPIHQSQLTHAAPSNAYPYCHVVCVCVCVCVYVSMCLCVCGL